MTFEEWWDETCFNRDELQSMDPITKGWLNSWFKFAYEVGREQGYDEGWEDGSSIHSHKYDGRQTL